jgi:large subunit ribosomal protein L9
LADALDKAGFKIERKNITLPTNNLKSVGKFEADVVLHKEVSGKISFEIVED